MSPEDNQFLEFARKPDVIDGETAKKAFWKALELRDNEPDEAMQFFGVAEMIINRRIQQGGSRQGYLEFLSVISGTATEMEWRRGKRNGIQFEQTAKLYKEMGNLQGAGLWFERAAFSGKTDKTGWQYIERRFREGQQCYLGAGLVSDANRCHFESMKMFRDSSPERARRLKEWVLFLLWGWGERPWHVAGWSVVIVLIFGLLFWMTGIDPKHDRISNLGNSLYLSSLTFTTVGYGDYHPSAPVGKLLAAMEGFCGIVFASLFLVTFVKKYS